MNIVLASASPRRHQLLVAAGFEVAVHPADIDETVLPGETPEAHVLRLAAAKAAAIAPLHAQAVVLGADTIVLSPAGRMLGKPVDLDEARVMLRELAGQTHQVLTGVCLRRQAPTAWSDSWVGVTQVDFQPLDEAAIDRYLALVDVLDKAGAYAIQEHGELIVRSIDGLLSNVIGLPVEQVVDRLGSPRPGRAAASR